MKLRIKGDSLRMRLTQGEVRTVAEGGEVRDRISFPGEAALTYALRSDHEISQISASYGANVIDVRVPAPLAARWSSTELVTLSGAQPIGSGYLHIVLEKDWAWLAPREGDDESDNFPNPQAGRGVRRC